MTSRRWAKLLSPGRVFVGVRSGFMVGAEGLVWGLEFVFLVYGLRV